MKRTGFLLTAMAILVGFGLYNERVRVWPEASGTFYAMGGIPVTVKAWVVSRSDFQAVYEAVRREFERLEDQMSTYRAASLISRVNARAAQDTVPISPDMLDVLLQAHRVWQHSHGLFDPTIGPLVRLWKQAAKDNVLPTSEELTEALGRIGMDRVILSRRPPTVHFERPGIGLDLGGIAKGYMCDRGMAVMRSHGIQRGLIEAGGDMVAFDDTESPRPFRVAIRNPDGGPALDTLLLTSGAVMTSGSYARYVTIQGRQFSHIINPKTGRPARWCRSVTVTGPTGAATDAWATAAAVRVSEGQPLEGFLPAGFRVVCVRSEKPGTDVSQ